VVKLAVQSSLHKTYMKTSSGACQRAQAREYGAHALRAGAIERCEWSNFPRWVDESLFEHAALGLSDVAWYALNEAVAKLNSQQPCIAQCFPYCMSMLSLDVEVLVEKKCQWVVSTQMWRRSPFHLLGRRAQRLLSWTPMTIPILDEVSLKALKNAVVGNRSAKAALARDAARLRMCVGAGGLAAGTHRAQRSSASSRP
jgi:hypothetical protein